MNNQATLIFPNQLFAQHPALDNKRIVYLIEDQHFFTDFNFHKQKLILHRASMKSYQSFLEKEGYTVFYLDYHEAKKLFQILHKKGITLIHYTDLIDHSLEERIRKAADSYAIESKVYETPLFLSPESWIRTLFSSKKSFMMHHFYIKQRKRMNILIDPQGHPAGGSWSFDTLNRQKPDSAVKVPKPFIPKDTPFKQEAINYVEKNFSTNPGTSEHFSYPIDHRQAAESFLHFLEHRLMHFGDYQDAIIQDQPILFHSLLSSSLNIGLITPKEVVDKAMAHAARKKIALNNIEGFIRQVIGWREYVRGVYLVIGNKQKKANFFNHTKKLPSTFYTGKTTIVPVDVAIQKILSCAYAHHIERLMILGNFMLLAQIDPQEVYRWFMELFIDSYEWVMVPNIFGMSQYADGGLITSKPYISSSSYIKKMSDYSVKKSDKWPSIWDAFFWNFISTHYTLLKKNRRMAFIMSAYHKKTPDEIACYKKTISQAHW